MRSPVSTRAVFGGANPSPWLVLDYLQRDFKVSLLAAPSADYAATNFSVQYTPDNPNKMRPGGVLSRAGTVATLKLVDHGLVAGDSVIVINSGDANLDGTWPVASAADKDTLTYTVVNTGITVGSPGVKAALCRVMPHDTMVNLTARTAGNFAFPVWAARIIATALTAGSVTLEAVQGYARG
jgi:hypothetical protein